MSQLLEILGRAITIDTADLIWHWLNAVGLPADDDGSVRYEYLHKAMELISDSKLDTAAEQLRLYLFENPTCTYGRLAAATICLHDAQLEQAVKELNSVYLRKPSNTMALYALGHCYERLGKESQAIEFYQDCLKFKRYLQLPAQRLAAIYFKNGQLEKTIQQYELLKGEYPDDISTLVTLGHLYIAAGRYMQAADTFNTAILMHPDNFNPHDEVTDRLIADGQHYDALEKIDEELQAEPNRIDLMIKRADVFRMLGATNDAVTQYEEALRMCPEFLEATIKLGTQYLQLEQDQAAAELFNKAVEINDKIIDAYMGLATSQKLAGCTEDALGTLSLAAAIQPNSTLLFTETAILRFKAGLSKDMLADDEDYSAALAGAVIAAHCQELVHRPQNPDLHYRLGILMMNSGRIIDAINSFQSALEINPSFTRARSKLAICLYEADRKTQALDQISHPACMDKDTLELHYKTALLYCDRVKFASSLINLEHYLEGNYASSDATVNISIILQNLGLLDRVTAMWDNLTDTASRVIGTDYPFSQ